LKWSRDRREFPDAMRISNEDCLSVGIHS
jgi:hypothetical protein